MKVYLHLADGFEDIEAIATADILTRAGVEVLKVSVTGSKEVTSAYKTKVIADKLYEEIDYQEADMIIFPGGLQGTQTLEAHKGLQENIIKFAKENRWIAAICAAPTILGKMGLLEGKVATCFPGMEQDLKGAKVSKEAVVVDGNIITSRAAGTTYPFALKLVEILIGQDVANTLKSKMLIG